MGKIRDRNRVVCRVSVPLIGDFVFNNSREYRTTSTTLTVSVPLIGDFVFNKTDRYTPSRPVEVSVPLIGDFVFNSRIYNIMIMENKKFPSP